MGIEKFIINTMQNIFLIDKTVILRPLDDNDALSAYPGWLNDPEVSKNNSHNIYPYSKEQATDFIRSLKGRKDTVVLAIVDKEQGIHIGNVSLQSINYINRCAELAILLGDKNSWGKGFGKEACSLMVRHAFNTLNLNRIELGTPVGNIGMQKIALWLGMMQEGTKRKAFFKNGCYHDIVLFGLLKEDFLSKAHNCSS